MRSDRPVRDLLCRAVCRAPVAALFLATSCATTVARGHLDIWSEHHAGEPVAVHVADFDATDLMAPEALGRVSPTADGSAVMRDALIVDPGLRKYVGEHGLPQAVVLLPHRDLEMVFVSERRVALVALDGGAAPHVVTERNMLESERVLFDDDVRRRLGMAQLRQVIVTFDRAWKIFERLRAVTTGLPPPEPSLDMVLFPSTPVVRGVYYVSDETPGLVVGWVAPGTLAADVLTPGDVVTAVDGRPVGDDSPHGRTRPDPTAVTLTVRGRGDPRDVTIPLEPRPPVNLVVTSDPVPNAFATGNMVTITTAMADLATDDDMLAAVLGHELAHIGQGHTHPTLTPGRVISAGLSIPIELVLPGIGHAAMQGFRSSFRRDDEREADRVGIDIARRAGFEASGAARVLEALRVRVDPHTTEAGFFATHPSFPERIEIARKVAG